MSLTSIIHVVDDDETARTAVARLLRSQAHTVCCYSSADEILRLPPSVAPGCFVVALQMRDFSGLELQTEVLTWDDPLPFVFVARHATIRESVRAIQNGAVDILVKPANDAAVLDAVARALAKDHADRQQRQYERRLRERYARLTDRERDVFAHVAAGRLNKQIAWDLGLAERTIKLHRHRVFEKLEIDSVPALTRVAVELGLVTA